VTWQPVTGGSLHCRPNATHLCPSCSSAFGNPKPFLSSFIPSVSIFHYSLLSPFHIVSLYIRAFFIRFFPLPQTGTTSLLACSLEDRRTVVRFPQVESAHPDSPALSESKPDKAAGHEAKLTPAHNAEFKNGWSFNSTTTYAFVTEICTIVHPYLSRFRLPSSVANLCLTTRFFVSSFHFVFLLDFCTFCSSSYILDFWHNVRTVSSPLAPCYRPLPILTPFLRNSFSISFNDYAVVTLRFRLAEDFSGFPQTVHCEEFCIL
jgi:hypothetical protein